MNIVPGRVATRLSNQLKRFQPIVESARSRDVNESDTVIIVTDMLCDVFGFEKYAELTSELCIRGTYCDLATKIEGKIQSLIEVKAAGSELRESHTKQAVDYAANQGIDWVVLTNGSVWKVYRVCFSKPVAQELVLEFDILALNPKRDEDLQQLYLLAKEGFQKSALGDYSAQRQALNRFCVAATLRGEPVLQVVRRELKRLSPDVKIEIDEIETVLLQEVIKRDVLEGDKADEARKKVARATNRALRTRNGDDESNTSGSETEVSVPTNQK